MATSTPTARPVTAVTATVTAARTSTVRTATDDRTTVMAVVEGRERVGRGNIGVAVMDVQRALCTLYQACRARACQSGAGAG